MMAATFDCTQLGGFMIKKGQRVHFLPEWQDEGDEKFEWYAYDDEQYKRVSITADIGLRFNGIQTVDVSMLVEGQ